MMAIRVIRTILAVAIEWFCIIGIWYRATGGTWWDDENALLALMVIGIIVFSLRDFAFLGWLAGKE